MPGDPISPASYPREQEADVLLRDGSTVRVRPVRRDEAEAVRRFLEDVSPESIAFRFFGTPSAEWIVQWSTDVDYADRFALVAETGAAHLVAHAAYIREGEGRAEVAFLVADSWQGRGISTILLAHLAAIAERHGISTFTAEVLPSNHRMIEVFRESGFPVEMRSSPDAIHVEFPTSLSPQALARFDERERTAAVAAVRSVLEPRSVAVIGASRRRATVGGEVLHNLLEGEFSGPVYAVNQQADVVQSLPAYRSVADIPRAVDLAVVVVPAPAVVPVARECAAAGVRALVVISAGFAEAGEEGARRQSELVATCRESGMRLVGPNCLGVLNTDSEVRLNATFAAPGAVPGSVAFMSQSGGVGIAIMEAAGRLGVGLSSFVSVGNKADLSGNDFLRYWEQDAGTTVALMYLESFGNPRKFARIAPWFARRKPLLAVKSGRSVAGARATASHTGALLSASDITVDALFEQAGVIRADSLHELFGVAALLSNQPVPSGGRVAIVTNAGGPGIMCADACQAGGVEVSELSRQVKAELARFLPGEASFHNPVDMIATASPEDYQRVMETLIEARACDAIVTIFVPPLVSQADEVAQAISQVAATRPPVAIAAVFMTGQGPPDQLAGNDVRVPGYEFPEDAARAVALAARHGRWLARPQEPPPPHFQPRSHEAAAVISTALGRGAGWLTPSEVASLLDCYGLPLSVTRIVPDLEAAVTAAAELAAPVALKAIAPGLVHKTDAGAVRLDLMGADAVRAGGRDIQAAVEAAGYQLEGLIVQPMAPSGVELIVGVASDPSFGPVLACGAGGTVAELIKDVAVRITPVGPLEAGEMLRALQTFPLLDGYRGAQHCDIDSIEDVLLRVSAMVEAHREIVELDCNPLIATAQRATIVDARIRVEAASPRPPVPSLRA
ncbi:MAG TPA: GNAT family N-acetyltransferase [Solirubrobacteraceae bacterium]|nr:GNAT family N-acetyltransferase [Solirubrobacteraceae bacterium]